MHYMESNKEESDYSKLRELYANLSFDEKYKWVIKAVSAVPDHSVIRFENCLTWSKVIFLLNKFIFYFFLVNLQPANISKILNKEEQRIFKGQIKTTPSAFNLYIKDTYNDIKDSLDEDKRPKDVLKMLAINWKTLDTKKKKIYENAAALVSLLPFSLFFLHLMEGISVEFWLTLSLTIIKQLKEQAAKEQESFNERHGVATPHKIKRRRSTFVARHPDDTIDHVEKEDEGESTPKKKKKEKNVSDANPTDSGSDEMNATKQIQFKIPPTKKSAAKLNSSKAKKTAEVQSPEDVSLPTSPNQSPVKVTDEVKPEKKKKTKREKLSSESSEHNESDAVHSSSSSGSRKRERKEKNSVKIEPPEKPPSDLKKYFAKFIHTGKPHKVDKALKKLTKKEFKQLNAEYKEKVEAYMDRLKFYLGTLPKEEAVAYVSIKIAFYILSLFSTNSMIIFDSLLRSNGSGRKKMLKMPMKKLEMLVLRNIKRNWSICDRADYLTSS